MNRKIYVCLFIIFTIFIFSGKVFLYNDTHSIKGESILESIENETINTSYVKEYEIKTEKILEKNIEYILNYPVFKNQDLNSNIYYRIEEALNEINIKDKDSNFKITLETDIGIFLEKFVFVRFYINEYNQEETIDFYKCYIFSLETGNRIMPDKLFHNYSYLLFNKVQDYFLNNYGIEIDENHEFYEEIKPIISNYENIFIKNDNFQFIIYDYKKEEDVIITIDTEIMLSLLKAEVEEITIEAEKALQEVGKIEEIEEIKETEATEVIEVIEETETIENAEEIEKIDEFESRNIDPNKPMIALTFDDGPNESTTSRILDILETNNARATFFVVGRRIERDAHVLKRMYEMGNQIGNHTFNHEKLTNLTEAQIEFEIQALNDKLLEFVGVIPTIVRVPYGSVNDLVLKTVNYPIIMWNVDTNDWKTRNANSIIEEVRKSVKDGAIILMHDIYDTTADACEIIIPELIAQGYQLVTIDELMEYRGIEMIAGQKYYNGVKQ